MIRNTFLLQPLKHRLSLKKISCIQANATQMHNEKKHTTTHTYEELEEKNELPKHKRVCWCLRLWHSFYNSEIVFLALISVHSAVEPFRKDRFKWLILVFFCALSLSLSFSVESFCSYTTRDVLSECRAVWTFCDLLHVCCVLFFFSPITFSHSLRLCSAQTLMPIVVFCVISENQFVFDISNAID